MTTAFVLSGGGSLGSTVGTAVHAFTLLIERRLVFDVAAHHEQVELLVMPPLCPLSVSSSDFSGVATTGSSRAEFFALTGVGG